MIAKRFNLFAPAAALLMLTAGILFSFDADFIDYHKLPRGFEQIMVFIAGVTFFTGLALITARPHQNSSATYIQINFNEEMLREQLDEVVDAEFIEVPSVETKPWEPTADKLVNDDPTFALAKVRIDIERELRRLTFDKKLLKNDQRFTIYRALDALEKNGEMPPKLVNAIREIIPICNRAVHGEKIDMQTARDVVAVAGQALIILFGLKLKNKEVTI